MSFRLVLNEPKLWRSITSAISAVVDIVVLHATPDSVKAAGMDPTRGMMLDMVLPKETFDEYECSEATDIAVAVDDLEKVLKRAQPNDSLTLRTDKEKDGKRLSIIFKGSAERKFSIGLHDMKYEELPKPKGETTTSIRLATDALETAVKDAGVIPGSEQVRLTAEDGQVTVFAEGDTSYMHNEFRRGSDALLDLEAKEGKEEKTIAYYSTEYLGKAMKAATLNDTVLLQYAADAPMKITFQLEKGGQVIYWLAPRRQGE